MFIFKFETREITDLETLEIYEVDQDSANILHSYLEGTLPESENESLQIIKKALEDNLIHLNDLQLWTEDTFRLNTPIVHIIQNCNSPCTICDCWKTRERNIRTAVELYPSFKKMSEYGASSIMVSGGEPTLNPELEQIIDDIHSLGMGVELNTNGTLLSRNKYLYKKNIEALIVSIDGFSPEEYKQIRGINKFETVCNNIIEFKKYSPETIVGIRVTLTKYTLNQLDKLIDLCKKLNIDSVGFNPIDVTSSSFSRNMNFERSMLLRNRLFPDLDYLNDFIASLENTESDNYKIIEEASSKSLFSWNVSQFKKCANYYKGILTSEATLNSSEPCNFPNYSLVVDYDQTIKPCFYAPAFSNLKDFPNDTWDLAKIKEHLRNTGICKGCRGKVFCG